MSHDHAHSKCSRGDDAGAYVLSALDRDEGVAFAAHLESCDHCHREVSELQQVVDTLPIAAPQAVPLDALKSRIMAVVNAEAELLRAAGPEADRGSAAKPRRRWLPQVGFSLRPALAGALACAALGIGVVGAVLVEESGKPQTRTVQAWAQGPAQARLMQTGDSASLELSRMPSLRAGQVYQVWFDKGDGQFRPTHTLFNVRSDGRARVAIDEPVRGVDRIAVTAEKSGGALAPSGPPVVTASPA